MTTHRAIQIANLNERASCNRVRYYINAIKAAEIGNSAAAIYFTQRAQQWDRIRIASQHRLAQ